MNRFASNGGFGANGVNCRFLLREFVRLEFILCVRTRTYLKKKYYSYFTVILEHTDGRDRVVDIV
jgi:hypothetical protein